MKPNTLYTQRLILRKISLDDKNEVFRLFSDEKNNLFTDNDIHKSIDESVRYIRNLQTKKQKPAKIVKAVCLKENNVLIGVISLYNIDYKHSFTTFGCVLMPEFQKKGIIPEGLIAVFDFAFNTLNMRRIEAQVYTENFISIKMFDKLNLIREGKLRQNFLIAGKFCDSYMYSILKEEFTGYFIIDNKINSSI